MCGCVQHTLLHHIMYTSPHTHSHTLCGLTLQDTPKHVHSCSSLLHAHTHTYIHTRYTYVTHTNMHIKHTQYTHIHHTHTHTPHTHHTQMHSPTNSGVPTIVRALPFFSMLRSLADPKSTNLIVELPSRARTIFSGCKPHKVQETLNHILPIATSTHRLIPLNTGMLVWVLKMTAHFA